MHGGPTVNRSLFRSAPQLPLFNNDRKHYTPAFLNSNHLVQIIIDSGCDITARSGVQGCADDKDPRGVRSQFPHCIISLNQYQPKPSSSFCFVCKEHFLDYSKVQDIDTVSTSSILSIKSSWLHQPVRTWSKISLTPSKRSERLQVEVSWNHIPNQGRLASTNGFRIDWMHWLLIRLWLCNIWKRLVLASPIFNKKWSNPAGNDLLRFGINLFYFFALPFDWIIHK